MSATLGVLDARSRFSELIDRAEKGEEITITRRGAPVARIVPARAQPIKSAEERQRIIEEFRRIRQGIAERGGSVTQAEIREWINEDRP
jgi:prevent-host-death family protein